MRYGLARTTVEDIAREASIHRTTVYKYFKNRNEVLAGVALAESRSMIAASDEIMRGSGRFADRLVRAFLAGQKEIKRSPFLTLLYGPENAALTVGATSASELLQERTRKAMTDYVAEAQASGELRNDVPAERIADWLNRVNKMLVADPPAQGQTGSAAILRTFVTRSLEPAGSKPRIDHEQQEL
jgi:AcrR family transcriptional regulator